MTTMHTTLIASYEVQQKVVEIRSQVTADTLNIARSRANEINREDLRKESIKLVSEAFKKFREQVLQLPMIPPSSYLGEMFINSSESYFYNNRQFLGEVKKMLSTGH